MAYLEPDAKRTVSKYSITLFLIGLLTFFSNIFQHYIYGLAGERATNNLREALFSGLSLNINLCLTIEINKEDYGRLLFRIITSALYNECSHSSE
jgi:hypothetical protein